MVVGGVMVVVNINGVVWLIFVVGVENSTVVVGVNVVVPKGVVRFDKVVFVVVD